MALFRLLTVRDLPDLLRLSTTANWNQLEDDWQRLLRLEPNGCFGIEVDGHIAASATVITYGPDLAWLGMVLTLPEHRGQGHASRLMQACLDYSDARGVRCLKLDATDMGRSVYRRFGFEEEYVVERWEGAVSLRVSPGHDLELDYEAFGADRTRLLNELGVARHGRVASYVGPLVARTPEEARGRLQVTGEIGPTYWDFPQKNVHAAAMAAEFGFQLSRALWRMRRGSVVEERPEFVYALAGFEYG